SVEHRLTARPAQPSVVSPPDFFSGFFSNRLLKKCPLSRQDSQRLEAAVDWARFTARVELVPFPFVHESRGFQQSVKPMLKMRCLSQR
ncbi:MAG: hypothetical protein ACLP0H_15610, partial [Terriglobales bacterium]